MVPGLRLPGPPPRVDISGPDGGLTVSWSPPKEDLGGRAVQPLSGYLVLRQAWPPGSGPCPSCPEDLSPVGRVDTEERRALGRPETAWLDGDAREGWTYRYRVRALDGKGRPGPPSPAATVTWISVPAPRVEGSPGDGQATLRLDIPPLPPGLEPVGTRVYGPSGRRIADVDAGSRQVVVSGLANGVPVTLSVRSAARTRERWDVESRGFAVTVTPVDTVPPLPPSAVAAFADAGGVRVHWLPPSGEAYLRVVVLRAPEAGPFTEIAQVSGNTTSYLDTAVVGGTTYLYTVVAEDQAGNRSLPARDVRVRVP